MSELEKELKLVLVNNFKSGQKRFNKRDGSRKKLYTLIEEPIYNTLLYFIKDSIEWKELQNEIESIIEKENLKRSYEFFKDRNWYKNRIEIDEDDDIKIIYKKAGLNTIIEKVYDNIFFIKTGKGYLIRD